MPRVPPGSFWRKFSAGYCVLFKTIQKYISVSYPFKKVLLHTFPFSCFILSNSLCCALIFASNSDSRLRISAWSRRFSSSRSARMDFCCCINVVFPVPVFPPLLTALAIVLLPDVFSLLFTQSFSSPDLPGDRLGERLVRLPGLRLFL